MSDYFSGQQPLSTTLMLVALLVLFVKIEYFDAIKQARFEEISVGKESHYPAEPIAEQPFLNELAVSMSELQRRGNAVVSLNVAAKKGMFTEQPG